MHQISEAQRQRAIVDVVAAGDVGASIEHAHQRYSLHILSTVTGTARCRRQQQFCTVRVAHRASQCVPCLSVGIGTPSSAVARARAMKICQSADHRRYIVLNSTARRLSLLRTLGHAHAEKHCKRIVVIIVCRHGV